MTIKFLYSSVRPLLARKEQEIINDCFKKEIRKSDRLEIAVGFFSYSSLQELDRLITQQNIKNVCLILGMHYFNGFPKSLLKLALKINERWQRSGIGEIRVVDSFKYHGKLYCFLKNNQIFSVILGSPNLSFLKVSKSAQSNQYEIALITNNSEILENSLEHIGDLKSKDISKNIATLEEYKLLPEPKKRLTQFQNTSQLKSSQNP